MSHNLDGTFQHRKVQDILAAAQQAEDKVHQVQDIAHGITGQSFHMFPIPLACLPRIHPLCSLLGHIRARPSVHLQSTRAIRPFCWATGHRTGTAPPPPSVLVAVAPMAFRTKTEKITCPYRHDPKVKEAAKREYKAFRKRLDDKYKARIAHFCGHCSGGGCRAGSSINYLKMYMEDQRRTREQVLAAKASTNNPLVFMLTV
jgi:hypothetical protein